MSDFVKIKKELLQELIGCGYDALNLMDNDHYYDYAEYHALEKALNEIKFEDAE